MIEFAGAEVFDYENRVLIYAEDPTSASRRCLRHCYGFHSLAGLR